MIDSPGSRRATSSLLLSLLILGAGILPARSETIDDGNSDRYNNTWAKDFVMDAPWRVVDAQTPIPLSIILKDCDTDDVRELHWIRCWDTANGGETLIWDHDFGDERIGDDASEDNYWTWITTVTEGHPTLPDGTPLSAANLGHAAGDRIALKVSIHYRDTWFNYTETRHLRVLVGDGPWPRPEGWYGGDVHIHSMYTNNIAEFGAPLPALTLAAEAMGLSWLTVTDHSCDLDETGDGPWSYGTDRWEYTLQGPGGTQTVTRDVSDLGGSWAAIQSDLDLLASPGLRTYRGVEINLASVDADSPDKTLHALFYNPEYIHSPLCGAIGERPVTPSLPAGLAQLDPAGFAYAAHPLNDLGGEWGGIDWTVNGDRWGNEDYAAALAHPGFAGLELFNTRAVVSSNDENDPWDDFDAGVPADDAYPGELLAGLPVWDGLLRAGLGQDPPRKVFVAGGSDAHGDFNYTTILGLDDYATDNALGKVRTVVRVPGPHGPGELPPIEDIMLAYREGRSIATDGPFLEIGLDRDDDGDWYEADDLSHGDDGNAYPGQPLPLKIGWRSSPEFGPIVSLSLLVGDAQGTAVLLELDPAQEGEPYAGQRSLDLGDLGLSGWRYFRAQCLSDDGSAGRRAITNPLWIRFHDLVDVQPSPAAEGAVLAPNFPNPFNPSTRIRFHLPAAATVSLSVYSPEGLRVATLLEREQSAAGWRSVDWRGRDDEGRPLPSGIYLYRLETAKVEIQRKMLLLK